DHEGSAVQPHCLAQDLRVPAETSLPKPIAYDHDRVPARHAILFQRESATQRRNGAENGEEVVGNKLSIDLPGFLCGRLTLEYQSVSSGLASDFCGGQIGEDLGVIPHVNVVWEGQTPFREVDFDDRFGIPYRQWTRHDVKQGEDGRVDADAERQCEHGHR